MGVVVWIVLTVARVVDDLHSPVIPRGTAAIPADGVRTGRAARGEEQQRDAHEDREITRCLAHTLPPHCLSCEMGRTPSLRAEAGATPLAETDVTRSETIE